MARPLEHGLLWYRHSTVQLHNPKIQALIQMYGMAGPGIYNGLLEQINHQAPKPYALTDSQLRYLARIMAMYPKKLLEVAETCISVGLFSRINWESGRVLTSSEIQQQINETLAAREGKRRNRARTNPRTNPRTNSLTIAPEPETETETETETDKPLSSKHPERL